MTSRLAKFEHSQSLLALLEGTGLRGHDLDHARAQMMRAEAIAELVHGAWIGVKRFAAFVARKCSEIANAYAESAIRAGARKRDAFLAQATDNADLERRLRLLQSPRYVPLAFTRA